MVISQTAGEISRVFDFSNWRSSDLGFVLQVWTNHKEYLVIFYCECYIVNVTSIQLIIYGFYYVGLHFVNPFYTNIWMNEVVGGVYHCAKFGWNRAAVLSQPPKHLLAQKHTKISPLVYDGHDPKKKVKQSRLRNHNMTTHMHAETTHVVAAPHGFAPNNVFIKNRSGVLEPRGIEIWPFPLLWLFSFTQLVLPYKQWFVNLEETTSCKITNNTYIYFVAHFPGLHMLSNSYQVFQRTSLETVERF